LLSGLDQHGIDNTSDILSFFEVNWQSDKINLTH
jgi:hypothetical protein